MTGDGVNDALALKMADLAIAMGSGAAATKAVSNLILLDGRFDALPGVVAEGRRIIANIERVSRLFLTKTTWAMLLAIFFGITLWTFPFLPRQLSAMDGYTIGLPAFALALLPNAQRYLPGFLRRSLAFCLPAGLAVALGVAAIELWMRAVGGYSEVESQTATTIAMSIAGIWVLATLSRPLNAVKLAIVAAAIVVFIAAYTLPIVNTFFGFVALSPTQLVAPLVVGCGSAALLEVINRLLALGANFRGD
jgi:cation-transporting ATPase E